MNGLTPQQEMFCRLYTQNDECFGNGVMSYAEAYNHNLEVCSREPHLGKDGKPVKGSSDYERLYNVCKQCAHYLLTKVYIQDRVTDLLNEIMTDKKIDSELTKVALQSRDLASKVAAIREYNKLKQRILEKTDITSGGEKISTILPDVIAEADRILKAKKLNDS